MLFSSNHSYDALLTDQTSSNFRRQETNGQVATAVLVVTAWTGIERIQALADISHSVLCCHSNETRAPIANPPNSAQLGGTPYHSPKLHPGQCSSVGMLWWTDRQTHRRHTFHVVYDSREM